MPSQIGSAFSKVPNFANLQTLAEQSPAEAKNALERLKVGMQAANAPPAQLAELEAIITASETRIAALTASSTLLKSIFPDTGNSPPVDFGDCISKMTNVASLQWAADVAPPPIALTGTVSKSPAGEYVLKTTGGRELTLVDSDRKSKIDPNMYTCWIEGFINEGEGQLTVQGTVAADGKSMQVEGYSPGSNPEFVFGRVKVSGPMGAITRKLSADELNQVVTQGRVVVATTRGEVEITDPGLKKLLAQLPRLGVILPGAPTKDANGKSVYAQTTDFMYALGGRFAGLADKGGGKYETEAQFAYSVFRGPVRADGETAKFRMENSANKRNWVGGTFVMDGPEPHFDAKYISNDLDIDTMHGSKGAEGSAAVQLLAAAEVVDVPEAFVRPMGPPG